MQSQSNLIIFELGECVPDVEIYLKDSCVFTTGVFGNVDQFMSKMFAAAGQSLSITENPLAVKEFYKDEILKVSPDMPGGLIDDFFYVVTSFIHIVLNKIRELYIRTEENETLHYIQKVAPTAGLFKRTISYSRL